MSHYRFACGCRFETAGDPKYPGAIPPLVLDIDNLPDCPKVWEMLSNGDCVGVFQLEGGLGRRYSKKLRPENLEHMAALGAILRPGPLLSLDAEGISLTEHYCRRKNGEEPVEDFHPALGPILASTYAVMVYQESYLRIAQDIAGFSLKDADVLRKSVGSKNQALLHSLTEQFLAGCKTKGILDEEQAKTVWGWILEAGRYAFSKNHAFPYGVRGYKSAYLKCHFPVSFYARWIKWAKHRSDPQDKIRILVNDARLHGVKVESPDLLSPQLECHPSWSEGFRVKFGLTEVKGVAEKTAALLVECMHEGEKTLSLPLKDMTWTQLAVSVLARAPSVASTNLIRCGALRHWRMQRARQLEEVKAVASLTKPELAWAAQNMTGEDTVEALLERLARPKKEGGGCANKNRVQAVLSQVSLLRNPPSPLVDSPRAVERDEVALIGVALSGHRIDSCKTQPNATCREVRAGKTGECTVAGAVVALRKSQVKTGPNEGKEMARFTLNDGTCDLDVVAFSQLYEEAGYLLAEDNLVVVTGEKERNPQWDSFIARSISQAS